jgi:hypothetical protein
VETLPLFTDGLYHNVNVRTRRIGVQRHHVTMLEGEFLSGEILNGG